MTGVARDLPTTAGIGATETTAGRQARARRRLMGRGLLYVAATLLALWVLVPLYLITVTAFSPRDVVYGYPKEIIPAPSRPRRSASSSTPRGCWPPCGAAFWWR